VSEVETNHLLKQEVMTDCAIYVAYLLKISFCNSYCLLLKILIKIKVCFIVRYGSTDNALKANGKPA